MKIFLILIACNPNLCIVGGDVDKFATEQDCRDAARTVMSMPENAIGVCVTEKEINKLTSPIA